MEMFRVLLLEMFDTLLIFKIFKCSSGHPQRPAVLWHTGHPVSHHSAGYIRGQRGTFTSHLLKSLEFYVLAAIFIYIYIILYFILNIFIHILPLHIYEFVLHIYIYIYIYIVIKMYTSIYVYNACIYIKYSGVKKCWPPSWFFFFFLHVCHTLMFQIIKQI